MNASEAISALKKHPVVLCVLLVVAVVGGIASFFSSIESIRQFVTRYTFSVPSPQIQTMKTPLSDKEAADKGLELSYGHDDDSEYALIIKVIAKFKLKKFNVPVYLNSISKLTIESLAESNNEIRVRRNYLQTDPSSGKLEWWTFVVFTKKPIASQKIVFSLGTNSWEIPVGNRNWVPLPYTYGATANQWHRARGELHLELPDPSWPIIRSARLLESSSDNLSLLEVVVENRSNEPTPIEDVAVFASHPKDPAISCMTPDPRQSLTLDWALITSEEGAEGAWTELSDTTVKVPVRYNGRGRCSGFSFLAAVPVSSTIGAGAVGRIMLKVTELPTAERSGRGARGRFGAFTIPIPSIGRAPSSVLRWASLKIGVNSTKAAKPVFPDVIRVSRSDDNQMLLSPETPDLTTR